MDAYFMRSPQCLERHLDTRYVSSWRGQSQQLCRFFWDSGFIKFVPECSLLWMRYLRKPFIRKPVFLLPAIFLFALGFSCSTPKPEAENKGQPDYRVVATIKDLMDSEVDPSADFIWNSVSTTVGPQGSVTKAPRNNDEWKEVRRRAITLLEATNLLIMPGRHVAKPGEKADNPKVESPPEEIEAMINKDRASWNKRVQALFD